MDEQQQKKQQQKTIIKVVAGLIIGFIIVFAFLRLLAPSHETISGTIHYNGIQPEDPTRGKVVLLEKEVGETDYRTANDNVPLEVDAFWHWDSAKEGTTYNLKAYVEVDGKRIADSTEITVTAPAINQVLVFNVTRDDLPASIVDGETTSITGSLDLNGYIPEGSSVLMQGRLADEEDWINGETFIASDGRKLSYDQATPGDSYQFRGILYDTTGTEIGRSSILTVTAPATNQVIRIHSEAEAPEETVSISGKVALNGAVEPNSTILMLQKLPGDKDYTAFDRIPAVNGSTWKFDEAVSGTKYDITATLQVNEQDVSKGTVLTVAAPAENEVITIDSHFSLNPPTQEPSTTCVNQQEGRWNVTITFPSVENAKLYHLQAGSSQGGTDILNETTNSAGNDITRNVLINAGQDYYTRYAYSTSSGCHDNQCFSSYSPTRVFRCDN